MRYRLNVYGHTHGLEFLDYGEAKAEWRAYLKHELIRCRNKYGTGKWVKRGKDNASIEFGCNLWTQASIERI